MYKSSPCKGELPALWCHLHHFSWFFFKWCPVKIIKLTNGECKRLKKVFSHQVMKVKISTNICRTYLVLITFSLWNVSSITLSEEGTKACKKKEIRGRKGNNRMFKIFFMFFFKHIVPQNVSLPTNWLCPKQSPLPLLQ